MKSRGSRKTGKSSAGTADAHALYVYCVGEHIDLRKLFEGELPGAVENAPVELIAAGDLAAVVSAVPLKDYGEKPLQARLADPAWVAVRAMRHQEVIEHFAARATVVPLRFGTIYLRSDSINALISDRQAQLRSIIEHLRGCEEWGINVFRNWDTLMKEIVSLSSRLREISERAAEAGPGQSYLLRKQINTLSAEEARIETSRIVSEIKSELAAASKDATSLDLLKRETGEHGEVVAKLAFLVARSRFDNFRKVAEHLAERQAKSGFRLEMTGPWPAYNFSEVADESNS
jgi:hypothetical protein